MRACHVVLLAAAALINASSAHVGSTAITPARQNFVPTTRFLRVSHHKDEAVEERAGPSAPALEKVKALVLPSAEKLEIWLNQGKSIDDVFTRLQLAKAGDKLLDSPQLTTWLKYVDDYTRVHPGKTKSAIEMLTTYYGDDALAKMLQAAKKVEGTEAIATKLEAAKMQAWFSSEKSADDVFMLLKLDKAGDDILANPVFDTWYTYLRILTVKDRSEQMSLYTTLVARYGDDTLAQIIQAAKKVGATRNKAVAVEEAQIKTWLLSGKSTDDVFTLLKLDDAGDDLLSSPAFTTWNTYLNMFKDANPGKKTSLFTTLKTKYGDEGMLRMVEAALKTKSSSTIAKMLQTQQFELWLVNGKSANDVFMLLRLDKSGSNLLENPLLNTFTKYMNAFNKQNPKQETTLIATMTAHYSDETLVTIFRAAKKSPETMNLATNLQSAQFQYWLSRGKDPGTVFTLLNLDKAGDSLLSSPLFTTFTKFTDAYHAKNPESKMTTYWIVQAHYNDDDIVKMILAAGKVPSSANAAKRMEAALFKGWMNPSYTPDDVFEALKLNAAGSLLPGPKLLKDPIFNYWMNFMDVYNKAFPGKNIPRKMLATTYKDKDLVKMVRGAKKNPKTKVLGEKLETEMLKQFIFAEKQPLDVATLLNVREKTDANWKLWKKYLKDYNKYHLREITT